MLFNKIHTFRSGSWYLGPHATSSCTKMYEAMKQLPWSFGVIDCGQICRKTESKNWTSKKPKWIISKAPVTWAFHVSGFCLTWLTGNHTFKIQPWYFLKFGQKKISKSIWWSIMGSFSTGFPTQKALKLESVKGDPGGEFSPPTSEACRTRRRSSLRMPVLWESPGPEFRWVYFCGETSETIRPNSNIAIQKCSIKFLFTRTVSSISSEMMPTSFSTSSSVFQLKCSRLCPNCEHSNFSDIA